MSRTVSGIVLALLLTNVLTLSNIQQAKIQPETGRISTSPYRLPNVLAFYYPWYGTPSVSGYWFHWNDGEHDPNIIVNGRRQIATTDYPLLDVYDCNNESLIRNHIEIAKMANIDGFVVSWWGIDSFEDHALVHIKNVSEQTDFKFTIYYETTSGSDYTLNDIRYLLDNYANSSSWYRIDGRPVIYVYSRAIYQLNPTDYWKIYGHASYWDLAEDVREQKRHSIYVIEPYRNSIGYVESNFISLPQNDTYSLRLAVSDIRNDCPPNSDVGFRIKIRNATSSWQTLNDFVVNFDDGWLDLNYDISSWAGQNVLVRVESYDGGVAKWASEWAAVDYLFIANSKGEILSPQPYFDNEWKIVVDRLSESGYNPFFIMDFGGHEYDVEEFAEYFLNFTDGIHTYNPVGLFMPDIPDIYSRASNAAYSRNKFFVATVVPGYNDTEIRSPGFVVDRQNGSYYESSWSIAKSSFPDDYIITSFNEWHEGSEIEPSREYGYQYIDLTRRFSSMWTVDDDGPADFHTIQEAVNNVRDGSTVIVEPGVYHENVVVNRTVSLIGENSETTIIDGQGAENAVYVTANNTLITNFTIQNGQYGIRLNDSCGNKLAHNKVQTCYTNGIHLTNSNNNILIYNVLSSIDWAAIWIDNSSDNIFSENVATLNKYGIRLIGDSHNNTVKDNVVTNNEEGIHLNSNCNNIIRNNASNNVVGISIWAWYNNITGNVFFNNKIRIEDSNCNMIYHNNFQNATIEWYGIIHYDNTWDNGYPSGGNYWNDYNGIDSSSGAYQNETGSDGIGDFSYNIDANNTDRYPLMNLWTSPNIEVTNVALSKTVLGKGSTLKMNVTITNSGNKIEGFSFFAYVNTTAIHIQYVLLMNQNSTTLTLTWNTTDFSKGKYIISMRTWPVPSGSETESNTYVDGWTFVTTPGDVTSTTVGVPDLRVDMRDIGAICGKFGTKPSSASWNPNMDVNDDGTVNMRDIGIACNNFMKNP